VISTSTDPASAPPSLRRVLIRGVAVAVLLVGVVACSGDDGGGDDAAGSTTTEAGSTTTEAVPDPYHGHTSTIYGLDERWICRPDLDDDQCRDLDVTVVDATGTVTVEEREADLDAPIDCFYVYPTVSADPGVNSDLEWTPDDGEALTVVAQAAQYARSCRMYAPVYRQVTLAGLFGDEPETGGSARDTAYEDVLDAWRTYVSTWNEGRGVVLIGHSQGAGILTRLVAEEIDDEPLLLDRLVAAHLFGASVLAPPGEVVGGSFDQVPACTSADEVGCVVTWSSYPADRPPVAGAFFGRQTEGRRVLCVDAVGLLGEDHADAIVPVEAPLVGNAGALDALGDLETRFVSVPDALDVSCQATDTHDYLAIGLAPGDDIRPRDGFLEESLGETWGLHLVDMNVALDDLVTLTARQGEAFTDR